jgi:hypothetical protein
MHKKKEHSEKMSCKGMKEAKGMKHEKKEHEKKEHHKPKHKK